MIRHINTFIFIFLMVIPNLFAQDDIYDCENSKQFANYLFNTNQFNLAQHEFERLDFFCDLNDNTRLLLLKTYRKNQHFNQANQFFQTGNLKAMSDRFKMEYIRLMMSQQLYGEVKKAIDEGLNFPEKFEHHLGIALLQKEWEQAYFISTQQNTHNGIKAKGLVSIASESYNSKRKKPWLAALMSVVIPGSGKAYSSYWGDGFVSLLFTASTGFFAYRAFNKYGTNNAYSWIAGGLAVSYYSANIYGGAKAAQRYNENLNHRYIHETEDILFSDY
ncbi:MAG: hypothetical protein PF486_03015 [Prolixibacteraceae bacterium]|jgi:hypothetical protein|nr:hypothetical protein [Prolixibacteraceae bacterium]